MKLWKTFYFRRRKWRVYLATRNEIFYEWNHPNPPYKPWGLISYEPRQILVWGGLGKSNRLACVVHECLHAIQGDPRRRPRFALSHRAMCRIDHELTGCLERLGCLSWPKG